MALTGEKLKCSQIVQILFNLLVPVLHFSYLKLRRGMEIKCLTCRTLLLKVIRQVCRNFFLATYVVPKTRLYLRLQLILSPRLTTKTPVYTVN